MGTPSRPKLRNVEVVPIVQEGRRLVALRDPLGLASGVAVLPLPLVPIVLSMDGTRTVDAVRDEVSEILGEVPSDLIEDLASQLDEAHFLEGEGFEEHRASVLRAFREAPERPPAHEGSGYEEEREALVRQIDGMLAVADPPEPGSSPLRGIVAPHIDPRRGARVYGHAYAALGVPSGSDPELFVVFGTAHAPIERPYALTEKTFGTPLGPVPTDAALVRELEKRYGADARRDELVHMNEHSIEFQAVMLRHVFADRRISLLPILCGRLEVGAPETEDLLEALRTVLAEDGRRHCVVAAADLAHVGPRFGDAEPYDTAAREALERKDRDSIAAIEAMDAESFFADTTHDADTRRVCGTSCIYAALRVLGQGRGRLLCYEQNVDPGDGSIVSYAAVALHGLG